ncbi:uncharacterized protein LOC143464467 [Clavelina lepadiformis]|uniref:Uncharacterized protein n=1 Tax=Clavelina lepadiformis TaxID=159417 RepID=A0ABP0EYB8_CLALP
MSSTMGSVNNVGRKRKKGAETCYGTTNLQLRQMGETLKSRIGYEVRAFCLNIENLVQNQERGFYEICGASPPQTVPQQAGTSKPEFERATYSNFPDSIDATEEFSSIPDETQIDLLLHKLMHLTLTINNCLIVRGYI